MQLAFLILGVANRRWRERLWVVFFFVDSACLRARLLACMDVGGCGTDGRFGMLVRTRVEGRERVQVGREMEGQYRILL